MKTLFIVAVEIVRTLLLSVLAALLAMSFAFGVDISICGEIHGTDAPGGGAAIGVLVLISVGLPTIIWVSLSEVILRLLQLNAVLRLISIILPTIVACIWMFQVSNSQCT